MRTSIRAAKPALLLALLIVAGLGIHAAYYYPFFSDDALISLRYAKRLCAGEGLTWTDGERVEGYTDLLWVLLNAPVSCIGLDAIVGARCLDFLGCALAALVVGLSTRHEAGWSSARLATGSAFFVLSGPVGAWALAGLEHGFMTGVLALSLWFARRTEPDPFLQRTLLASFLIGLLCLLRADGVVLFVAATLGRWIAPDGRRGGLRPVVSWLLFPLLFLTAQTIFRVGYYGELVPNTAVAKVSFSTHRLQQGLEHVYNGLLPVTLLWALALAATVASARHGLSVRWTVPATTAFGWMTYLAIVGGDIFPGWRQLLLSFPPLVMLIADGAERVFGAASRKQTWALAGVLPLLLAAHLRLQMHDSENRRAKKELWEWAGKPVGTALKLAFGGRKPLLAVDAAGALPYWSGLPALDMLGLNDHYIPRHPPAHFGRGTIGHELGDGRYIWQRRPDLIAFCGAVGAVDPCFYGGRELIRLPQFHKTYQIARIEGVPRGTFGDIWFNREGKLGVERNQERIVIPGHLLAQGPASARLGPGAQFETVVTAGSPAHVKRLNVPSGQWLAEVEVTPPDADVELTFACNGISPSLRSGAPRAIAISAKDTELDIMVGLPAGASPPVRLRQLRLSPLRRGPAAYACDEGARRNPVVRTLDQLGRQYAPGAYWASPEVMRLSRAGLRVLLPKRQYIVRVEFSADDNDVYEVTFISDGIQTGSGNAPAVEGSGLVVREVEAPMAVTQTGVDELLIRPRKGDGSFSIGHVKTWE